MKAGEEFNIRPIAPCEARRIEAGIFNYGSDIRLGDTPFHVMGLERLVEEQPQDYIGKAALEELRTKGVDRKLVGIILDGDELRAEMSEYWPVHKDGKQVGHMTDAVWSPGLKQNIGYVWVPIELAEPGTTLDVESENGATHRHDGGDPVRRPEEGSAGGRAHLTAARPHHGRPRDARCVSAQVRRICALEREPGTVGATNGPWTPPTRRTEGLSCYAPTLPAAGRRAGRPRDGVLGRPSATKPIDASTPPGLRRHVCLTDPGLQGAGRRGRRTGCCPPW